ncbi:MAG: TIGR01459 family HAD-type hydrolase [Candidatus Paracaedimonas acanthamoebae]|uniref:TIGR01459 family HAD-type hydrolase n=1 Tax=Candidatus Paracaedimonas acanthamoebae TaxID=244581 RepID=A0A8J7PKB6_9PROT|nr:TIGR01459 family HAD-type hydrolase [Candidatus Paracaedimonas acanthamoebae]
MIEIISQLRDLVSRYQTFILGIEGVLYSGKNIFPEALEVLRSLQEEKKGITLLTNQTQRLDITREFLAQKGIKPHFYQHLLTAGEEMYQHLSQKPDPWHSALGNYCYFIGSPQDQTILYGLTIHTVRQLKEADFILVMGRDEWHNDPEEYYPSLEEAAKLSLKMICVNSNLYTYEENEKFLCPGAIGRMYEKLGGEVYYHGKPYPSIYTHFLKEIGPVDKKSLLVIGDSLAIDIQGAINLGLDSLLTISSYTCDELGLPLDSSLDLNEMQISQALKRNSFQPTFLMDKLVW